MVKVIVMTTLYAILKYKCSWKQFACTISYEDFFFFMLLPTGVMFNLKEIGGETALQGERFLGPWSHAKDSVLVQRLALSGSRAGSFLH